MENVRSAWYNNHPISETAFQQMGTQHRQTEMDTNIPSDFNSVVKSLYLIFNSTSAVMHQFS